MDVFRTLFPQWVQIIPKGSFFFQHIFQNIISERALSFSCSCPLDVVAALLQFAK
jgi:hypothetical protein